MNIERMGRDEHNDQTVIERVDPLVGSVLDRRYRIDFRLAAGGFGAIYRATHVKTGHQVALKVLHTDLATSDARVIVRFRREGETLLQLRSKHTVTAYELGEALDGPLYIVMELLHGESLFEQFRAKGPLAWRRMLEIAVQVCSSLGEAHKLGIVHRDLKPANINLEKRPGKPDFVKVLDFGIAKIINDNNVDTSELTQAGQMIGTFDYMAPEQMVGGQCTSRTDIYTLGVVMYEMISGRRPFADATSPTAMLASLLTLTPSPLSAFADVPPALDTVLLKCLEREPQNRYQDVEELARDLEMILRPIEEGVTRRMSATPAPSLMSDEVTVIDHRRGAQGSSANLPAQPERARRDSSTPHPNVIPREGSSPLIEPPRQRRDTPGALTPNPNVIRREPTPLPVSPRPKHESSSRRDPSQPPFASAESIASPGFAGARRTPEGSAEPIASPGFAGARRTPEGSAESIASPGFAGARSAESIDTRGSQPPFQNQPEPARAPEVINPSDPRYFPPSEPTPQPYANPYPGYTYDPNAYAAPAAAPAPAWNQQPGLSYPTPASPTGYDMAGAKQRELVVRRIVWAIAIALGVLLAFVIASRM